MAMPIEIRNAPMEVREHYARMIRSGQSERWALMCALQEPPGTRQTERAFFEGRNNGEWLNKLPKKQAERMLQAAREVGVNPSGKIYFGGIADKRGIYDPEAWVADASDVKRVAEKRGMDVDGAIQHRSSGRPVKKSVDIAPDILKRETAYELSKNPQLSKKEARAQARARIVPHWKKKNG
jgi:hypothetical protein